MGAMKQLDIEINQMNETSPGLYDGQVIRLESGEFLRWRDGEWQRVVVGDNGQFIAVDDNGQIVGVGDSHEAPPD